MVASGHSCPVGQLSTSGTQFSWVTGLFCYGSVKLPNNAPSLSEQCQLHTGTGKGQHGKLHLLIPDFCASCQQPQIALRGRGGAGQAGRHCVTPGLQGPAQPASSGRRHTRRKKQEEMWSFSCLCICALFTLQLSKSVTFNCFENHMVCTGFRGGSNSENEN